MIELEEAVALRKSGKLAKWHLISPSEFVEFLRATDGMSKETAKAVIECMIRQRLTIIDTYIREFS
jgi:predicted nucleic-acid-binding protein